MGLPSLPGLGDDDEAIKVSKKEAVQGFDEMDLDQIESQTKQWHD